MSFEIVFYLYSTSNHNCIIVLRLGEPIVFYLYSTSNHNLHPLPWWVLCIVFYLYSTSNHNTFFSYSSVSCIVFYLYSTSNHNWKADPAHAEPLYSIFILHQTTTCVSRGTEPTLLYSIFILHQTTTLAKWSSMRLKIVFYLYSTSNHNVYII